MKRTLKYRALNKTLKQIVTVAAAIVALSASVAFAAWKPGDKKIVVGTATTYPPYEYLDTSGTPAGFDIDLMTEIGKRLGSEVEWFNAGKFDSVLAAIPSGKVDCAIAGMGKTPERMKKMLFSDVYEHSSSVVVMKKERAETLKPKGFADLKGLVGAVQQGTLQDSFLMPIKDEKGFTLKLFPTFDECVLDIVNGRADFTMFDYTVALKYMANPRFEGKLAVTFSQVLSSMGKAIGMRLGSTVLCGEINKALAELKAEGIVQKLYDKYNIKPLPEGIEAQN